MPHIRVIASEKITTRVEDQLKRIGLGFGYSDPRKIWVSTEDTMRQNDVAFVEITVAHEVRASQDFKHTCDDLAAYLRTEMRRSIEVGARVMDEISWFPTEEGAQIYGG